MSAAKPNAWRRRTHLNSVIGDMMEVPGQLCLQDADLTSEVFVLLSIAHFGKLESDMLQPSLSRLYS